jgi:hypothetical protein
MRKTSMRRILKMRILKMRISMKTSRRKKTSMRRVLNKTSKKIPALRMICGKMRNR